MNLTVAVERVNGKYAAVVPGFNGLRREADTPDRAVEALRFEIDRRLLSGELVLLDVQSRGLSALAGRYANDEIARQAWREVVAEICRQRDEEKAREFPE